MENVMTGNSVPPGVSPDPLRAQAVHAIDELMSVVGKVGDELRAYETVLERARRDLESGMSASDMVAHTSAGAVRASFSDRLNDIERARAASRLSMWRMQLSEGSTIADVARAWGYSRQLVSRALAGRTRAESDPD
jgi:hypothetical protein